MAVALVALSACGSSSPEPTPTTDIASPTSTDSPSGPAEDETIEDTLPTGFFSMNEGEEVLFRDGGVFGLVPEQIRIESHDDFERVVVDFTRIQEASSSGQIELWVVPAEEARADGSGEIIPMDGEFLLGISIPGLSPRLDGPLPDVTVLEDGIVRDVAHTGFEGGGGLYLGLSSSATEYRLSSTNDPYRVMVDVRPANP